MSKTISASWGYCMARLCTVQPVDESRIAAVTAAIGRARVPVHQELDAASIAGRRRGDVGLGCVRPGVQGGHDEVEGVGMKRTTRNRVGTLCITPLARSLDNWLLGGILGQP
jgi:hypothetical protein